MAGSEDIFQRAMNEGHSAAWDQAWEQAVIAYKKALAQSPDNPKALNSLGLALFQQQKFDEALKVYTRAAQISPTDPTPFEKIAFIQERQGKLQEAIQASYQAAELFLKNREVEKAIENWLRVVQLNPEHIQARSRLAFVHEKTGQIHQAATEYIAVASLLQNAGNLEKSTEILKHAQTLETGNSDIARALGMVTAGKLLPKPTRPKGGTGPLRMAQVKQLEAPREEIKDSPDPISEARKKALNVLADALFQLTDESSEAQARRGLQSIMKGTGQLSVQSEQTRILLHLSQAIDAQTKGQDSMAADELEKAIESGFNHPSIYFDLGYLRAAEGRAESALRNLQQSNKHADYELASYLLSAQILLGLNRLSEAATANLEALKIADESVVTPDEADMIRQLYEPLIESIKQSTDDGALQKLCANVQEMLSRLNWRAHLRKLRSEMPQTETDAILPLAEILIQAQSSHVIEAMNHINQLARKNQLRSAMDEAFQSLLYAPTYLPLHILIGELLVREGQTEDAITKFTVIANSYSVRGEAAQATKVLRKIIQLAPMDLSARTRLIDQLVARGQQDEAISEYMDMADIYYRLAELERARKTYTTALRLAQQPNANRQWSIQILRRMADIDMQRLEWKQALRILEQLRTLRPDDEAARTNIIELNLRMAQPAQAQSELASYMEYLESNDKINLAIPFIEKLAVENDHLILQRELAAQHHKAGRTPQAISMLDTLGDQLMEKGDKQGAREVVAQILAMNPPNGEDYRSLLAQL
ncbi:MAG: tetratricopeptide repeat protein [Anaerolineales bacterium]|jgi:tetratricopeptide (TPR) repeat protein|nr:tetratricopeptide repeat protein [Anaerolineales bacterium]